MDTNNTDPRTASKQAEQDLMAMRLDKVNKLAAAKETHEKAVQQDQEDELRDYSKQLDLFMKRVPDLIQMATQLAKLATLPTVKMSKFYLDKEEYIFGASTYESKDRKEIMSIGATRPREGLSSARYLVIGADGQWVTNKDAYEPSVYFNEPDNTATTNRCRPNAKDFMLAALEWEKQLFALVDSL